MVLRQKFIRLPFRIFWQWEMRFEFAEKQLLDDATASVAEAALRLPLLQLG
jgi:hypothetical protein